MKICKMQQFSKRQSNTIYRLKKTLTHISIANNFDIYNISSSSDNIRIILSFYLSLLQTSIELDKENIKFPNILILDEPKQQNLDNDSLLNCINVIEKLSSNKNQVILTTYSEVEKDKERFQEYIIHEMKNSTSGFPFQRMSSFSKGISIKLT